MNMPRKPPRNDLTAEQVRGVLHYDPETGDFTWKIRPARCMRVGDAAGTINSKGHRLIRVFNQAYQAHRLAWLIMTGAWPADEIDHRNRCRSDNRWSNLREATRAQNARNQVRPKDNKTGITGVTFHKGMGRWRAYICVDSKNTFLGWFDTIGEAAQARASAVARLHGEFAGQP